MRTPRGQGLVFPAVLLVLGLLVTAAIVQERRREERLPTEARELADLVRQRRAAISDLSAELQSLSNRLGQAQAEQARGSERVREVVARLDRLRVSAGVAAVTGPGIAVELADSPEAPRSRGELTDLRIQDVDLQLVVNGLWAAGAEAVSVNGRRVVATTAIREAGGRVLVNFDPVSSPYRVVAIGDPEALRPGVADIARQFQAWSEIYGLGFSVRGEDLIRMPGLGSLQDLEWARPAGEEASP